MSCCTPSGGRDTERTALRTAAASRTTTDGMVAIPAGTFLMGSQDELAYPADGEGPVRTVHVDAFWIDARTVTNAQFAEFAAETGYRTSAERIGWSFVFAGLLPDDFPPTRAVAAAPWWRQVEGADWRRPDGPQSTWEMRPDHPVIHVDRDDARAYCAWAASACPPRRSGNAPPEGDCTRRCSPGATSSSPAGAPA